MHILSHRPVLMTYTQKLMICGLKLKDCLLFYPGRDMFEPECRGKVRTHFSLTKWRVKVLSQISEPSPIKDLRRQCQNIVSWNRGLNEKGEQKIKKSMLRNLIETKGCVTNSQLTVSRSRSKILTEINTSDSFWFICKIQSRTGRWLPLNGHYEKRFNFCGIRNIIF